MAPAGTKAASAAAPKETNRQANLARGLINNTNKEALTRIIKLLRSQPGQILPCLSLLESGKLLRGVRMNVCTPEEQDETPWPATYIRLCKLPKYWICAFLKNKFSHISQAQADQLIDRHGNLMMEAFWFVTATGAELQFPKGTHDKRVCTQVFSTRAAEVGHRLSTIERPLLECLLGKAKLNWQTLGIYHFEAPEGEERRVAYIRHISGVKARRGSHDRGSMGHYSRVGPDQG